MPRAKATDELSEEARVAMMRGFVEGWTAERIVQAVKDATGDELAPRTVARRAAEWRESKRRFDAGTERMKQLLSAADEMGTDPSAFIRAIALDALRENPNAFDDADPIKVQGLALGAEELRLKRRKQDLAERALLLNERRLTMLEAREQRVLAAVQGGEKKDMTAEDRIAEVRSILGLREPEEAHAADAN